MPRALCLFRENPIYRRQCFIDGLRAAGFRIESSYFEPEPGDCLVLWNRYGRNHEMASRFESFGGRVVVAENAYVHRKGWYSLSLGRHAGAGAWPAGGPERWDSLGIRLQPWRAGGAELVILAQRSIGEKGIASPKGWEESMRRKLGARIRPHPGKFDPKVPLERDLQKARAVVTWASSSALQALIWGIPVYYGFRAWIGAPACRHVDEIAEGPRCDDRARLNMLERLAWAQAHIDEIRCGEAFCRLLGR